MYIVIIIMLIVISIFAPLVLREIYSRRLTKLLLSGDFENFDKLIDSRICSAR